MNNNVDQQLTSTNRLLLSSLQPRLGGLFVWLVAVFARFNTLPNNVLCVKYAFFSDGNDAHACVFLTAISSGSC